MFRRSALSGHRLSDIRSCGTLAQCSRTGLETLILSSMSTQSTTNGMPRIVPTPFQKGSKNLEHCKELPHPIFQDNGLVLHLSSSLSPEFTGYLIWNQQNQWDKPSDPDHVADLGLQCCILRIVHQVLDFPIGILGILASRSHDKDNPSNLVKVVRLIFAAPPTDFIRLIFWTPLEGFL